MEAMKWKVQWKAGNACTWQASMKYGVCAEYGEWHNSTASIYSFLVAVDGIVIEAGEARSLDEAKRNAEGKAIKAEKSLCIPRALNAAKHGLCAEFEAALDEMSDETLDDLCDRLFGRV